LRHWQREQGRVPFYNRLTDMEYSYLTTKPEESEMRENQKSRILAELQSKDGSSTKDIGVGLHMDYGYALEYLKELQDEDKVYSVKGGTPNRPRLHWFLKPRNNRRAP